MKMEFNSKVGELLFPHVTGRIGRDFQEYSSGH
jgi:hypothetical protein